MYVIFTLNCIVCFAFALTNRSAKRALFLPACLEPSFAPDHRPPQHQQRKLVDCNSQFESACCVCGAHGSVANAPDSEGYHCALRLALHTAGAPFTSKSTVTVH
jgi:hypothetical protein